MNIQQQNTRLFEHIDRWATFILANMLWVVCSLPLVTLPAATAGLFAVMSGRARGKQSELFQEFFGAMRQHWLKASLIVLLDLLIGGLLVVNFMILPLMSSADPLAFLSRSVTIFAGLALGLVNLYIWPLLVMCDAPLGQIINVSLRLAFAYPVWSIGALVAALLPVGISLLLPRAVFLVFTVSCAAFIASRGAWHIIRQQPFSRDIP